MFSTKNKSNSIINAITLHLSLIYFISRKTKPSTHLTPHGLQPNAPLLMVRFNVFYIKDAFYFSLY